MAELQEMSVFDFGDVRLLPAPCVVTSRSEVDTSVKFGPRSFRLPVVPANMSTIIDQRLAVWLAERNYFYVMHRFDVDSVTFTKHMHSLGLYASISVGVKVEDFAIVDQLAAAESPEYVTIDIAHGDAEPVLTMVRYIRERLPEAFIIAGNVATPDAVLRLEAAGAHAAKVGIGPGCFVPGTSVRTREGLVPIENIAVGDLVLTHRGRYRPVVHKFEFGHHRETIVVNGIECTPDHEFYVCDKARLDEVTEENYESLCYWVSAKDLDPETQKIVRIEL